MNNKIIFSENETLVQTDEGFVEVSGSEIKSALDIEKYIECLENAAQKLENELQKKDCSNMSIKEIIKTYIKKDKIFLIALQILALIGAVLTFFILRVPSASLIINGDSFSQIFNFIAKARAILVSTIVCMIPTLSMLVVAKIDKSIDKYNREIKNVKLDEFKELILKNQEELKQLKDFIKTPRPELTEENIVKKEETISIPLRTEYSLENEADEAMTRRMGR